ncbi:MAG: CRISPR-associated protein Csx3 [Candidatus Cloacimonadales bacterium]|nr:CRISPR-associated protein Csx3 [Candidatus Cloacimonadales bacterium]
MTTINLSHLYTGQAKLKDLPQYLHKIKKMHTRGEDVIISGQAPVWLYLKIAHELHGIARSLTYNSPVTGEVIIFDHNPF